MRLFGPSEAEIRRAHLVEDAARRLIRLCDVAEMLLLQGRFSAPKGGGVGDALAAIAGAMSAGRPGAPGPVEGSRNGVPSS